jgi:hypothetical protein
MTENLHAALGGNRCEHCSAWSELLAYSAGGEPVKAMCLNPASGCHGMYMSGGSGCTSFTTDPALADHPSVRAPNARPNDEGRTAVEAALKLIAPSAPKPGIMEQLRGIFGPENVIDLSAEQPARPVAWKNEDRLLPDYRVERTATRTSAISNEVRTKVFVATAEEWAALDKGALIQQALPHLTLADREFLMTGITDEEWNEAFPEDDEDPFEIPPRPDHR